MGCGLWVLGCGLLVVGCGLLVYLWDKLMVGFAFQPTTDDQRPTISSTRWSVCLGMLSSARRKHRMRR